MREYAEWLQWGCWIIILGTAWGIVYEVLVPAGRILVSGWGTGPDGLARALVPMLPLIAAPALFTGLNALRRLLDAFAREELLVSENVNHLQCIGRSAIEGVALYCFVLPILQIALTGSDPVRLGLTLEDGLLLLLCGTLYLIGWVVAAAVRLREENESFA